MSFQRQTHFIFVSFFLFQAKKEFFRTLLLFAVIFLKTKLTGDSSAKVVVADSVMGWVNSVSVVCAQVSTIVSSQTVSVSVSTCSIGVSTISITVVGSGLSISLGFSLSITPFTGGTGNGNVSGIDTGSTLDSVSVDTIVSSIMSVSSKTVSGVSGIAQVSGISQTGVSTVSSQAIAVAVVAKTTVVVGIKDSGVSFGFSLSVGSDDKGGDNCNL